MTDKQKKFVDEYLLSGSATAAAKAAGYSDKSARYQGSKLLRNVEVSRAIEERRRLMANEKILTATQLQEFLSSVVRGEVRDEQLMTRLIGRGCSIVESYEYRASVKDRLRAAELLLKIHGAFREKMEVEVNSAKWFADELEKTWKENPLFEQSGLGV